MNKPKRMLAVFGILCLLTGEMFLTDVKADYQNVLTFSENGIETQGSGFTVDGTSLTIAQAGVYKITGTCSNGSIAVKGSLSDVVLILENLDLSCDTTAPLMIKKASNVTVHLSGSNVLSDNEDPAQEETNADYEGAAVKFKTGSSVTFCGDGSLTVNGYSKNGIKGASESSLTINKGTFNVTAANNAITADGNITVNGGSFNIESDNDGIKSVPDVADTVSEGKIEINGGTFVLDCDGDGIQADQKLLINNGYFNIHTYNGYNSTDFDKDTMSCKGLKASGDRELDNQIIINGGTFDLDTADDAVHSDTYITIAGGTFDIRTGDDGVHADTTLTLGSENGYDRDPEIYVESSYEGLEAGTIYSYSGSYYVNSVDDGINAASGSSDDSFKPWPGYGGNSDYNMYFYGGNYYVNCDGDGLDSNGGLYLYGGRLSVLSMGANGDNSPLDADGSVAVNGATVFATGSSGMGGIRPASGSQRYVTSSSRFNTGTVLNVADGNSVLYSEKMTKNVNYTFFSSPETSSSARIASAASLDSCRSNSFMHSWDDGVKTGNIITYTCADCGETQSKSIPGEVNIECDGHPFQEQEIIELKAGFIKDEGVERIDVYYTQDYSAASETDVDSAAARNGDTGEIDDSGNCILRRRADTGAFASGHSAELTDTCQSTDFRFIITL